MGAMTVARRLRRYAEIVAGEACLDGEEDVSKRVASVLARVPRHRFLEFFYHKPWERFFDAEPFETHHLGLEPDEEVLDIVYSDEALITRLDDQGRPSSSASQPSLVAAMLYLLDLEPGMRVLEIGAGTGYNAALIAELVEDPSLVTTIDIQSDVVDQTRRLLERNGYGEIRVMYRDGALGAPEHGPFDRVVATVGCPDISWRWAEQLATAGVALIPLQHGGPAADPLVRLRHADNGLQGGVVSWSGFMPIQGNLAAHWPELAIDHTGEPDARFDLPPSLAEAPLNSDSYRTGRRAWWDFAYFLALEDTRAYFGGVLALSQPSGDRIILDNQGVRLWGDRSLYDDFLAAYHRWESLGYPKLSDWHVRLLPRTEPRPRHDPGAGIWVVSRPASWQTAQLG